MQEFIRLQKWVSQLGLLSRREAERLMLEGMLKVNGQNVKPGILVDPKIDQITLNGKNISENRHAPKVYWLFHKPDLYLTSHQPQNNQPTIYQLPCFKGLTFKVNSVGRLDFRTEGLLLMTNDGEMSNRLCHPSYKLPRTYQVLATGKLNEKQLQQMRNGVDLSDGVANCKITYIQGKNLGKSRGSWYMVTVTEGRNRLVRRLFEHFDMKVIKLIRSKFGDLSLDESLKPGEYRQLTAKEIKDLKTKVQL